MSKKLPLLYSVFGLAGTGGEEDPLWHHSAGSVCPPWGDGSSAALPQGLACPGRGRFGWQVGPARLGEGVSSEIAHPLPHWAGAYAGQTQDHGCHTTGLHAIWQPTSSGGNSKSPTDPALPAQYQLVAAPGSCILVVQAAQWAVLHLISIPHSWQDSTDHVGCNNSCSPAFQNLMAEPAVSCEWMLNSDCFNCCTSHFRSTALNFRMCLEER